MHRPPEVVGRRAELEALAGFLERVTHGFAGAVLCGPAGMGKSTLWLRGLELAREAHIRVTAVRPSEAEARLSYAGLSDLLGEVEAERFEGLSELQRRAVEVALLRRDAGGDTVDARAVASGVLSLLRDLAATGPVLVAVDDAQWLDGATARALAYALRRLQGATLGVLATVRADEIRPRTFVDALPPESRIELTLPPLSVAAVHAILLNELGISLPRPTLVKVVAASGGNPFYALEIARELERVGDPSPAARLPVPDDLRALVRKRLGRLPARTNDALLAASCLGVPRTTLVAEDALGPAEEAGIVRIAADGRIEFVHPVLAAAVYESASTARRRAVHRRLVELVSETEERARHLALCSDDTNPEAARELERAARLASARGAPGEAAELAELAIRLTPERDAERPGRLVAAAAYQFQSEDLDRARLLLEQAVSLSSSERMRAQALRLLGQLHARRSSFAEAIETELAARSAAGEDDELTAGIELDLAFYRFNVGDFAGGYAHARAAVPRAEVSGVESLLACALAVRTVTGFLCGRGIAEADLRRALAMAIPLHEAPLQLHPRFVHGFLLLCTGRLDESLATLEALRTDAIVGGLESEVPILFLYLVWALVWRGNVDGAMRIAGEARETAALLEDGIAEALALAAGAVAFAYAGDADRARLDSEAAIASFERLGWAGGTIWPRWARGFVELSRGDPVRAHEALRPLDDLMVAIGPTDPALALFLPDEVEALVRLGRVEEALPLLDAFHERARTLDRAWALAASDRCRALVEAARGDLETGLASIQHALEQHARVEMPFERARTLLELGRLQRRRRQKRLARDALEEALGTFESIGTPLWAGQARAELARVATRRAPAGLTATEERIARLAAEGLTNRAIAERAFVTVNTVEANLKRAYRKLGISSRAQLGRALDEQRATSNS